uniref:Myosin motor domain-containing protein n=1 Tax=Angiostrongylus cantonensis TaxID=6313 RepID=A0A0K0DNP0_ANGCA
MVRLVEYLSDGRVLVRIGAREMTVDSTDIDRMNPTHLDRVGDFASLRYLNETSAVHLLRQRFGSNLLYTNAGLSSVVCLASLEEDIVGEDRLVSLFKGCRRGQMPAHICATAQQIYRNLQMTGQDQCIVLTGVSGSGKTTQLRKLIRYFAELPVHSDDKLALAMGVVEAFGHASSALHRDSTRFLYLFSLGFDKAAALRAGRFQVSLLEAERLGRVCGVEAAFHVFYYLWEGADGELRERLQLDSIDQPFIVPYSKKEDKQSAKEAWERLQHAFFELGLTQGQFDAVNSVLAAILHLQAAGCTPGYAQRAHFLRITHAQQAASLLGVSTDELGDALFRGKTNGNKAALKVASAKCRMALTSRRSESSEALLSFCAGLYQELFYTIVDLINKAMVSNSAFSWISVFDYPGSTFHINWTERSGHRILGLSDLVYNYINECVTELFYNTCFVDAQEVYSHEQVDVEVTLPIVSPCTLTRLLDQKQQLLACTDIDRRSEEKRGLFAILEEESLFPGATDESLLERFFIHLGDDSRMIRRASSPMQFVLEHAMSCYPTVYDVSGWVKQARPCESGASVRPLLLSSKR